MAWLLLGVGFGLVLVGHRYKVRGANPIVYTIAYALAAAAAVSAVLVRISTHGWFQ